MTLSGPLPKVVIFDLDGTLVDSAPDIAEALNHALTLWGLAPFTVREVQDFIGGGSMVLLQKALAARGHSVAETDWPELVAQFMGAYHRASALGRGLFPGARAMLDALKASGCRLAICTNKPHPVTETAMPALGIADCFEIILGATDERARKPAPDMIAVILSQFGVGTDDAVMVGDSGADFGAARAAGIPIVLVSFGYAKVPVETMGADAVVGHLEALPSAIAAVVGNKQA